MLVVNGSKAEILETEFKFSRYIENGLLTGYQGFVCVSFLLNGKKGYFDFYLNHIIAPKISCYENQSYCCVPIDDITEISYLEIFDTSNFYDVGEFSEVMKVQFGQREGSKIKAFIEVQESFVSLSFHDYLEIIDQ